MLSQRKTTVLLALAALAGAIYLAADAPPPTDAASPVRKRVRVAAVEAASAHREVRFSGVTRAEERARLAFAIGGRIVSRPVEVGDRVRQGETLATLDARELANAVDSARAALAELAARRAQTERDHGRLQQLAEVEAATTEELERASAGMEALQAAEAAAAARLREAEREFGESRLAAPFTGTVTEVLQEPGEVALAGHPVVVLAGDGAIELAVELPESVISHVVAGSEVQVELPALSGARTSGTIASVSRVAGGPGQLFPVVTTLSSVPGLVAGMTAELVLSLDEADVLALPVAAVINPGGRQPAVFCVRDGRVVRVPVTVGTLRGDQVTVTGELKAGDLVVVGGQRGLLDGEAVEVEA